MIRKYSRIVQRKEQGGLREVSWIQVWPGRLLPIRELFFRADSQANKSVEMFLEDSSQKIQPPRQGSLFSKAFFSFERDFEPQLCGIFWVRNVGYDCVCVHVRVWVMISAPISMSLVAFEPRSAGRKQRRSKKNPIPSLRRRGIKEKGHKSRRKGSGVLSFFGTCFTLTPFFNTA